MRTRSFGKLPGQEKPSGSSLKSGVASSRPVESLPSEASCKVSCLRHGRQGGCRCSLGCLRRLPAVLQDPHAKFAQHSTTAPGPGATINSPKLRPSSRTMPRCPRLQYPDRPINLGPDVISLVLAPKGPCLPRPREVLGSSVGAGLWRMGS